MIKDNIKHKRYDILYLTNCPAFYKIHLMNEIAKDKKILVLFLGYTSQVINGELDNNESSLLFDYCFLTNNIDVDSRNRVKTFLCLLKIIRSISFKKVIYTGWNEPEFTFLSFFIAKNKNCMQCESSIYESNIKGLKRTLKKIILKRMSCVLVSGIPHEEIFKDLHYKGKIFRTQGVGIFNKRKNRQIKNSVNEEKKYLYVGRLIEKKNLYILIQAFNQTGKLLTIVGKGELEDKLKKIAKSNISFLGFIDNNNISDIYISHDIFILPSYNEPWGLVVEEALYNGLPVVVSNKVGCNIDLVKKTMTGSIFLHDNINSLVNACDEIENNYSFYKNNVDKFDFDLRDKNQIDIYKNLD